MKLDILHETHAHTSQSLGRFSLGAGGEQGQQSRGSSQGDYVVTVL